MSSTSDLNSKVKQTGSAPSSGRNSASSSPVYAVTNPPRSYGTGIMSGSGNAAGTVRMGAGSPSYESSTGRYMSRRTREIQIEEGVVQPGPPPGLAWVPPSSGSTSLRDRENIIPESPPSASGTFPESATLPTTDYSPAFSSSGRRARAGTLPSRFTPGVGLASALSGLPSTSRPSPAPSPFKSHSPQNVDVRDTTPVSIPASSPAMDGKSRLRSGSLNMPPRTNYVGGMYSSSFFPIANNSGGNWNRERSQTTTGIQPTLPQIPSSPAHSTMSREDDGNHMAPRTLDYLGLADSPASSLATLARPLDPLLEGQRAAAMQPFISELPGINRNVNRMRSYSVNAKEKYAEDEDEEESRHLYSGQPSGTVTPSGSNAQSLAQQQTNAHLQALAHSLGMQNSLPPSNRPRARTASVLDSPAINPIRNYLATPSKLDSMTSAADIRTEYFDVSNASDRLRIGNSSTRPSSGEGGLAPIEESNLEGPTRALWLGNIPPSTTTTSLVHIFSGYGAIESARVLTHKNCGFINYETTAAAVTAKTHLHNKELFPGSGPTKIGYAKPSTSNTGSNGTPTPNGGAYGTPSPDPHARNNHNESNGSQRDGTGAPNGKDAESGSASATIEVPELPKIKDDILEIVKEFGAEEEDVKKIAQNISTAIEYDDFKTEIPTVEEPSHSRVHDAPKLREIRKKIDNGNASQHEIEEIALQMLPEIAELSSDYLGNTVVQKLFEFCSEETKESMLVEIGPHLAKIGIHKNGTWAGQKIIDVAKTDAQMQKITECLRPYTVALFLDQYGNYVLQCCLRFNSPFNDYVFETMLSRLFQIAQGRFGSRAMRACLESHHANKNQQRMLAAAIALHSVQLATNANGALLLTWFLDTCTFPKRRTVLAPLLVPHLVHLCTHKVAYLTVLKVINQKNEPEARDIILKALFFSPGDRVLEDILRDHSCGATLIFKVLTTPFFDDSMRNDVSSNVRNVLQKLKATPSQGYKRLMDEVGLSTRNGINNSTSREQSRDRNLGSSDRRSGQQNNQAQGNGGRDNVQPPFYSSPPYADPALAAQFSQGPGGYDSETLRNFSQLSLNGLPAAASMYGGAVPGMANPAVLHGMLQQPFGRPPGIFGSPMGPFNPQIQAEQFRNAQNAGQMPNVPMMGGMGNAFNPLITQQLMGPYAYGMNGIPGFFPQPQQQPQPQGGGRRGGRR